MWANCRLNGRFLHYSTKILHSDTIFSHFYLSFQNIFVSSQQNLQHDTQNNLLPHNNTYTGIIPNDGNGTD